MILWKKCLSFFAALVISGATSSAATITDYNFYGNGDDGRLINTSSGFTDSFDIRYGYNPQTQTINTAVAYFSLWDGSKSESVSIDLGSVNDWKTAGSFDGDIYLGGVLTGTILVDLREDGVLNYRISLGNTSGSYYLEYAWLAADVVNAPQQQPSQVPDGGATAALLGASLIGLTFLRRVFAA